MSVSVLSMGFYGGVTPPKKNGVLQSVMHNVACSGMQKSLEEYLNWKKVQTYGVASLDNFFSKVHSRLTETEIYQ